MDLISLLIGVSGAIIPVVLWLLDRRSKNLEIRQQQRVLKSQDAALEGLRKENIQKDNEIRLAKKAIPKDLEIIEDVDDVLQHYVLSIIRQKVSENEDILIENFGLDLESVIPWLNNKIIHPVEFDDVHITMNSLIVNPESIHLKDLVDGDSNITTIAVNSSIASAKKIANQSNLTKFSLVIRQYDCFPIIHGFVINKEHLFLGFTNIENGKLIGGTQPYIHLTKSDNNPSHLTNHYFQFFDDWFKHYWSISNEIINVNK